MQTSLFDFELPESYIALAPASPRDSARMLVVGGGIADNTVAMLPSMLRAGDVMVFNDTRVLPARLIGMRGAARVEILLHKQLYDGQWQCFAKPAKRLQPGDRVEFAEDFFAVVQKKTEDGQVILNFDCNGKHLREKLQAHGAMPLPPYIERQRKADRSDASTYQTVYARHEGSVAAPTAGLHFTPQLLAAIDAAGVKRVHVTLHVGGGTFLPVKVEDTNEHVMHSEWAQVSQEVADAINEARKNGGRVIAVGTTSLRTLESASDENGVHAFEGETNIFITPGYRFKAVDVLMTNFHLPRSTLFMLVCAFCGIDKMKQAYRHAIDHAYRFYSYGDACLLYKQSL